MKKIVAFLLVIVFLWACSIDDDVTVFNPKFSFTFNWNGEAVTSSDFNDFKYTNENGEQISIIRMRYLVSDIVLIDNDNAEYLVEEYNLADLTNQLGLSFTSNSTANDGVYKAIRFTMGFNEDKNVESYADLNATNWNWPAMLGSGYHMMQYEGKYLNATPEEQIYALHVGTRRVSDGVFEPNHFTITHTFSSPISLNVNSEIEIKMNIAEWYKSPNLIDLNQMTFPIMPNYNAQVLMHQNGQTVFDVSVN